MYRHSDMIEASTPTSSFDHIVTDSTGDAVGHTAEGLVIKVMSAYFAGARPVELDGNSPQPMVSGTTWVDIGTTPTGSPTYPLDVVAAFPRMERSSSFQWPTPRQMDRRSRFRSTV